MPLKSKATLNKSLAKHLLCGRKKSDCHQEVFPVGKISLLMEQLNGNFFPIMAIESIKWIHRGTCTKKQKKIGLQYEVGVHACGCNIAVSFHSVRNT